MFLGNETENISIGGGGRVIVDDYTKGKDVKTVKFLNIFTLVCHTFENPNHKNELY